MRFPALEAGVGIALINYNVKEISLEYNVRRRKPKPGKWKAYFFGTRSRAAEEIAGYSGVDELRDRVGALVEELPTDGDGRRLKTTLALGGADL